jgi:hypothetical protein
MALEWGQRTWKVACAAHRRLLSQKQRTLWALGLLHLVGERCIKKYEHESSSRGTSCCRRLRQFVADASAPDRRAMPLFHAEVGRGHLLSLVGVNL